MKLRRAKHADALTHPIFADQKLFGMTLNVRFKLLASLMVAGVILNALSVVAVRDVISTNHANRLSDEKKLACLLVQGTPPGNALGDEIRRQYRCPPYSSPAPPVGSTSHSPTSRPSSSPIALPDKPAQTSAAGPSSTPGPRRTRTRTITRTTTRSRSGTRSSPHTTPPIIPPIALPSLCSLPLFVVICGLRTA